MGKNITSSIYKHFTDDDISELIWIGYDTAQNKYIVKEDYLPRTAYRSVKIGERVTKTTYIDDYRDYVFGADFHATIVLDLINTETANVFTIECAKFRDAQGLSNHTPFSIDYTGTKFEAIRRDN